MKARYWVRAFLTVASVVVMGAAGSARAADKWVVLGQQELKAADPSVQIKSGREHVTQVKISAEGADVAIDKIVLKWDDHPDETITDIGTLRSGGQTTPHDAPGHEARLEAMAVQYKILGNAPTATLKIWGFGD
jgi:hypothetical protein